jgi:hypothetical protein
MRILKVTDRVTFDLNSYSLVKFISGRNPDLFVYSDNGDLLETIDLSPFSTEEIHNLLIQKGFTRKSGSAEL